MRHGKWNPIKRCLRRYNMMLIALLSRSSGPSKLGGGVWGRLPPPDFGRYVNPILIRGDDYAYCITTAPPSRFLELPTNLRPWQSNSQIRKTIQIRCWLFLWKNCLSLLKRVNEKFDRDFCIFTIGTKMSFEIVETVPSVPLLNLWG